MSNANTLVTHVSAMTLVTLLSYPKFCRVTKGARRATVVALQNFARPRSPQSVLVLLYGRSGDRNIEFLLLNVDGRDHVFVYCVLRQAELFTKDVEGGVTSDEANQVVTPPLRLGQWPPRGVCRTGKPHRLVALLQRRQWGLSFKLAIAVHRIMLLLKNQRLPAEIRFILHDDLSQEPRLILVIEFLNNAVAPRLCHGNKPSLDTIEQAKPYQVTHATRVSATSIEDRFVINLHVTGYSQTAPAKPDSVYGVLTGLIQNWVGRTPTGRQVDAIQTEESNRPTQIARTNEVHLVHLVNSIAGQFGVLLAFRLVAPRPAMRQLLTTQ